MVWSDPEIKRLSKEFVTVADETYYLYPENPQHLERAKGRPDHEFFKKYGDRFEDSEGKQIFLEFAEEERDHRDMLIKEYRALQQRLGVGRRARRARPAPSTH